MAEAHGVLVIGEVNAGQVSGTTKEVLAAGRPLAQQAGTALYGYSVDTWGSYRSSECKR